MTNRTPEKMTCGIRCNELNRLHHPTRSIKGKRRRRAEIIQSISSIFGHFSSPKLCRNHLPSSAIFFCKALPKSFHSSSTFAFIPIPSFCKIPPHHRFIPIQPSVGSVLCHSRPTPQKPLSVTSSPFLQRLPSPIHRHLPFPSLLPPNPKPRTHFFLCIKNLICRIPIPRSIHNPYTVPPHSPLLGNLLSAPDQYQEGNRLQQISFRRDAKKSLRHCHFHRIFCK